MRVREFRMVVIPCSFSHTYTRAPADIHLIAQRECLILDVILRRSDRGEHLRVVTQETADGKPTSLELVLRNQELKLSPEQLGFAVVSATNLASNGLCVCVCSSCK